MKWYLLIFVFYLILASCSEINQNENSTHTQKEIVALEIPDTTIDLALLSFNRKTSLWTLKDSVFSGYAVHKVENGNIIQKFGLLNGRKQNKATDWYPNGLVRSTTNYHKGKMHGKKRTWTSDSAHFLISDLNYYNGKVHGEQKKWYPTGELFLILNLEMGKEKGVQQAFRKNGDLYANYEARKGRIFGLKKAALCFGLEEQKLKK